ncbi:MAG: ECF transporter S component [Clostridiaceae bacterium]|nr:ECF transporter S component [Clostridiaceae bacterium]
MDKNKKTLRWITRTAIFVALLVVVQAATAGLGNQFVTGSAVNLILIVSVMTCGLSSGATVAIVSPLFAKLFGIGPLWQIIPMIMLGNFVLVLLWRLLGNRGDRKMWYPVALIAAAGIKFLVLWLGVAKWIVPIVLGLPAPKAAVVSAAFSWPQLVTALIGGVLAILVLPLVKKAIKE